MQVDLRRVLDPVALPVVVHAGGDLVVVVGDLLGEDLLDSLVLGE